MTEAAMYQPLGKRPAEPEPLNYLLTDVQEKLAASDRSPTPLYFVQVGYAQSGRAAKLCLPATWNVKAVHYGGAVFDGVLRLQPGGKQPTIGLKDGPTPLRQGYVTFGSDSGHQGRRDLFEHAK